MLLKEEYSGFYIFAYEKVFIELGKDIVEKRYEVLKKFKDDKRSYVAEIKIKETNYIFKEPKNEYIIPQRKFLSLFKKGEALTTLINIQNLIENERIKEYVRPLSVILKRKNGMIVYSGILFEKVDYRKKDDYSYLNEIIETVKKIHNKGYYHGDCNPSNFTKTEKGIRVLDTQGKKMFFGNYRAHYDMLSMEIDTYKVLNEYKVIEEKFNYPYKKNIFYYVALLMKKIKKLKLIEEIKKRKKKLRDKGWKV